MIQFYKIYIIKNLFLIRVLHWGYFFMYLFTCVLVSLIFFNKSFLQVLLMGELLVIFFFFIFLTLSVFYNLYYLVGISFFLLVFGGLELSLSLLLLTL